MAHILRPPLPSADKRWKIVEATVRRHGYHGSALIETLHTVQELFGYIDEPSLKYVAAALRLPLSKVYGVATFYHFFRLKPKGEHTIVVCMGTACYIKGAGDLLANLEAKYGVKPGGTTKDGKLSVLCARCVGSCSISPAVVLDDDVIGKVDNDSLMERLDRVTRS